MPEETQKTQRLDPDAPLVLDVRRLGRRPGSMLRVSRSVPAPADLGLPVIGVPEGATIELEDTQGVTAGQQFEGEIFLNILR